MGNKKTLYQNGTGFFLFHNVGVLPLTLWNGIAALKSERRSMRRHSNP